MHNVSSLQEKDTPQARLLLADILIRTGRFDDASTHYRQAYMLDQGKTPKIILFYAEFLTMQNDRVVTQQALKLTPAF